MRTFTASPTGCPTRSAERERGAFFGSIHKTLNHLLWADRIQMSRFTDVPRPPVGIPESVSLYPDWNALKDERARFDGTIVDWADAVEPSWLAVDHTYYSGAIKRELTKPRWVLVDPYVQPPDPSSRPGSLPADAGRRQAARYRSAVHAGLTRWQID